MAKVKERIEDIKQRMLNIAQQSIGLPLLFRPVKGVGVPAPVVMSAPKVCDSYRVEVTTPTGFGIDVGQIAFDTETGNLFAVVTTPTIGMLFDKMDPKDRF